MKKKAEERLVPFFKLPETELQNIIKQLSPQEIGEIRQLSKIKKQELSTEIAEQKQFATGRSLELLEKRGQLLTQKIAQIEKAFDKVFNERKQEKQKKSTKKETSSN
ncbi:hypothetical protein K9M09_02530 [Patescibacteria group bacterium]|nr:hypothetical protein [Patescibacteria group bacterium]